MSEINKNLAILGLRPGAKQIEIKNSYRNLALIHHPDNKETGSESKFREIKEAYEALFDKDLYDQELKDLKKDPEAYYQARAKFPMAFEENKKYKNTNNKSTTYTTKSNKPTPNYYKTNQKTPKKTTTVPPSQKKKKDDNSIAPYCIGGGIVAVIIALLAFPHLLIFAIIIGVGAYLLLK